MVKKGGILGVCDFFKNGNFDHLLPPISRRLRKMEAGFHEFWFKNDNVRILKPSNFDAVYSPSSSSTLNGSESPLFGLEVEDSETKDGYLGEREVKLNWIFDGIFILVEEEEEEMIKIWDEKFRGKVPFLPFLQPYHGVVLFQKA